jgi:L-ascorbate metabolism protein UlaG (beta-lactamase superfamily)
MKLLYSVATWLSLSIVLTAQAPRQTQTFETTAGPVKITPMNHASTLIEAGDKVIYVDPAKPAGIAGFPLADLIIISDIHGDHLDPDYVTKLSKSGTEVWAPTAVAQTVTTAKVISNGDTKTWDKWTIEAIPMYNIKNSAPNRFHDKGRGNGYVLNYGGKRFYFSGDTEGTPEMRALKNIDVAFVCMNMPFTMTPAEAAEAVKVFRPKIVIPYHYRGSDLNIFKNALDGTGIEVRILDWYPKVS